MTKQLTITIADWVARTIDGEKNRSQRVEELMIKGLLYEKETAHQDGKVRMAGFEPATTYSRNVVTINRGEVITAY